MSSSGRIQHLDIGERQQLSGVALQARWGAQHRIVPKHLCRLCGHNRKQTRFFSRSLNEEVRKIHCLPAWGESHDPTIYYVIRDGIARELSDTERQQLEGRKNYDYPECDVQGCPNFGKLMVQPRSQVVALLEGISSRKVEVVTFECLDKGSRGKHLHSVHILQPDGSRLQKIGERGARYRGVDSRGATIETVPLMTLHPITRKPVDPEARKAKAEAQQVAWNNLDSHPKLQNSIDTLRQPEVQEKRLANMLAVTKGAKYPHRGPQHISPEERRRRSEQAKKRLNRPADWYDKPIEWRIIATELLSQESMSNLELAKRLDNSRVIDCPYGASWKSVLSSNRQSSNPRAVNFVREIRKWIGRPGRTQGVQKTASISV